MVFFLYLLNSDAHHNTYEKICRYVHFNMVDTSWLYDKNATWLKHKLCNKDILVTL